MNRSMTMTRLFATWLALMLTALVPAQAEDELLRAEEAFTFDVSEDAGEIVVDWRVVDGYYLYKEKIEFSLEDSNATLEAPFLPRGVDYSDEFFGEQQIYTDDFQARLPYSGDAGNATLVIRSQGCSKSFGICFPPTTQRATLTLASTALTAPAPAKSLPFGGPSADDFLPPDQAFQPRVTRVSGDSLEIGFQVAPGYYLYSESIKAEFGSADYAPGQLGLPAGEPKSDEYFGDTTVYYDAAFITVPLIRSAAEASVQQLTLSYQGCAEDGICYPVMSQTFDISVPAGSITVADASGAAAAANPGPVSEQSRLASLISGGNMLGVLGTFFALGLLLSLTPCVLPMVPILSGIISGEGENTSAGRGFFLALLYVLGMALTYTSAGALFAYFGGTQAATFFQQPWILITFAGLFVVLAMSMFGLFELQMPSAIQSKVATISNDQKSGTAVGAFVMGSLSSLVVTACVAPPLVAALAVIAETGNVARGSSALFAMSMGMGTPLLIVGASAGRLLPKVGPWMETVKQTFGFIMLGVAIYMLSRLSSLIPGAVIMLAWAVLIVVAAIFLGAMTPLTPESSGGRRVGKAVTVLGALYGAMLFVGGLAGGEDPLQPFKGSVLAQAGGGAAESHELEFVRIKSVADLDRAVADASANGRPVMLDFYADWCASCKEMEKYTFTDAQVGDVLSNTILLQADVTANDDADQALMARFGLFGPPAIIFFGPDGVERPGYQIAGYMKAPKFASHAREAIAGAGPNTTTAQR
ncbi:MAG: protein-disulfide reductase DsbD [Pseudomonadota bacterium]